MRRRVLLASGCGAATSDDVASSSSGRAVAGYHAAVVRGIARMLAAALAAGSCTTMRPVLPAEAPRGAVVIDAVETRDCLRTTVGRAGLGDGALPGAVEDAQLLVHLAQVPADVRRTAWAAGLEPLLAALLRARATGQDPRSIELLAMRLQVVMRISSLEIEVAALLFEADCTGDQMEAALLELDRQAGKQELALTIASIAVGALAGLGAGLWDVQGTESKGPAVLGIAGGVATAALGGAAFVPRRGRVVFAHGRNLFGPVVVGRDPQRLYPTFVFRMLTAPAVPGEVTPRDELLGEWQRIVDDAIPAQRRALAREILHGEGGVYDGALLDVRERMYDALESQLNAFDRDLEALYRFFGRVLDDGAQVPT